jgi:DNA polymerase delta subunit 1
VPHCCQCRRALQVLTSQSLATFTLADCAQTLLGETLEVLGAHHLAALYHCVRDASQAGSGGGGSTAQRLSTAAAGAAGAGAAPGAVAPSWQAAAARLARYALRRVQLVRQLLERLATLPEAFEMARVTGLTINQVRGQGLGAACRLGCTCATHVWPCATSTARL